jgi:hypothetical protein
MSKWADSIAQKFYVYPQGISQKLDGCGSTGLALHHLSMDISIYQDMLQPHPPVLLDTTTNFFEGK